MVDEYVTKEDCRRIHEDLTYQINDVKDMVDGVDEKLYTHDKQAADICSNLKIVSKDVDRIDKSLRETANIVRDTAMIQQQAEKERTKFQEQMLADKAFYQKVIWRMLVIGSVIVLAYFGIVATEKLGFLVI